MSLGETIRIAKQKAFYNQSEFAKKLNVAVCTVNHWEQNKVCPNVKAMTEITRCPLTAMNIPIPATMINISVNIAANGISTILPVKETVSGSIIDIKAFYWRCCH